jgi:stearoyl-CoA desaturase (delta-9 desaturase)
MSIKKINWLFVFQLLCAVSMVPMIIYGQLWQWAGVVVVYSFYAIGATVIFHRLLTHRSYKAPLWFEYLGTLFGTLGGYGSSIVWTAIHRAHHRYVDTDRDPHSPAHKGWFAVQCLIMFNQPSIRLVPDLLRSKFHGAMHNYYWAVHAVYAAILYAIDPFAVVYAHLVPSFLIFHAGGLINNWGHTWGFQSHTGKDTSRNNPILGYLVFGEGWHNNHHANPIAWKFSEKWWQLDLGATIIKVFKK